MAPTPKKTTAITKKTATKSTGSEAVKKLQSDLNKKGANLKVDGIQGALTNAAIKKYGSSTPTTTKSKTGGGKSYATVPIPKASMFSSLKGSGNFFKNVLGGAGIVAGGIKNLTKDAISTITNPKVQGPTLQSNAYQAGMDFPLNPTYIDPATSNTKSTGGLVFPSYPTPDNSGAAVNQRVAAINKDLGLTPTPTPTSFSGDASGSLALAPGQFTDQPPIVTEPTGSGTQTVLPTEPAPGDTPPIEPVAGDMGAGAGVNSWGGTAAQQNGINQALMGMKDTATSPNPWDSKGTQSTAQEGTIVTYANNLAKNFTSPQQATDWFNSQEGQGSAYVQKGGTLADLTAKVKPITTTVNGIQPAQTTAEYLSGGLASQAEERKIRNEIIAERANMNQQQKDVLFGKKDANGNDISLGIAEQQKKENEERTAYYERLEKRFDKNEKEKTRLAIDKARAEFEMKDAETEIARINAKNNLTEFLAKIGALRTDGNALLGIEKLEQSYQAQRQQLRQNFLFAEREIRQASEERMFNLETDLEDKKFKLSQDLAKTEREVLMEGMKLDNDYNLALLKDKLEWSKEIRDEREKAAAKAEKAAGDWTNAYLTTMGADMFKSLPEEFRTTWLANNPIDPRGYKTTQGDLANTFADWQQKQGTGLQLTDTQVFNLQKQGVDVEAYKSDPEYRAAVNSNLE